MACEMGALLGGADAGASMALANFGNALGYAFQISDDLLDAEGGTHTVGKATGKDAAAGKATLVSLLGLRQARETLDRLIAEGIGHLNAFGEKAAPLADAARFLARRQS